MIFLWIAIALIAIVLAVLAREDWRLLTTPSRRTLGRVIGHRKSEDDGISYMAQVEFSAEDGALHRIEDSLGGQHPRPAVEEQLEVIYPLAAPGKGRVHRPLLRAFLYVMLLGMMAPLVATALGWIEA